MKATPTAIPDVLVIEPKVFGDSRGFFYESFNQEAFNKATGLDVQFVQDNHSRSSKGVLRGLHYQLPPHAQGKLVRCTRGAVWDVAVDIRKSSATFGQWVGIELTEDNHKQFWIPPGFAHGFVVLSESADFLYKATQYYAPSHERCILWSDPTIEIKWPLVGEPMVSAKDAQGIAF
jgi:dTDP-4-dehydrorhamnose 3,5-epimerase